MVLSAFKRFQEEGVVVNFYQHYHIFVVTLWLSGELTCLVRKYCFVNIIESGEDILFLFSSEGGNIGLLEWV